MNDANNSTNQSNEALLRFKQLNGFFNTITEEVGSYKIIEDTEDTYVKATISDTISELDFYKCFLYLKSGLSKSVYQSDIDKSLTPVNIDYMAAIMAKPLSFTMPSKSKNSVQRDLATELDKSPQSAYSAIHRLRNKGYLIKTEDNLIATNGELQMLRIVTKKHLASVNSFAVSYLLNFIVK